MSLDQYQQRTVDLAKASKVMIMTGGPGTGKTFTFNSILKALDYLPHEIALASPTGKAATRMAYSTGRPATTIHRLLQYQPQEGCFAHGYKNKLPYRLIVIDEASMIDIRLAASLFSAIDNEAQLILVGDKDQLPSVGPGNVLKDIIASGVVPVAELLQIHRQDEHSWIALNSAKINQGQMPTIDPDSKDFFWIEAQDPTDVRGKIIDLVANEIPVKHGINPNDIQVLAPVKKGECGVAKLNEALRDKINPRTDDDRSTFRGFQQGDKVIHLRNNYQLGVFNGETGIAVEVSKADKLVIVDFGDRRVEYDAASLEQLAHAYVLTIHKSQGSEWPVVVMPVHSTHHYMLSRNLLYTGLTRAAKMVFLVGNQQGLVRAVKNNQSQLRFTGLAEALRRESLDEAA